MTLKKWHGLPAIALLAAACTKPLPEHLPDLLYNPVLDPADFTNSTNITNPYFPLGTGKESKTYIYEGQTEDGLEHVEVSRLPGFKTIIGIRCVKVHDRVFVAGTHTEDTEDWYAQDNAGNVWYMGEATKELNPDGSVASRAGSWQAGVNGAKPGFQMLAAPKPGRTYRQEYLFGEAEDEAEVIATGLTITVPTGTYTDCIKIKETTALEPKALEYKFYAPGIGQIKEVDVPNKEESVLVRLE